MSERVTPAEARLMAIRFINRHFGNTGEGPRVSIPANPDRDDDIRLLAFIERAERDEVGYAAVRERASEAARTLIVEIGASGPENVDDVARRAADAIGRVTRDRDALLDELARLVRGLYLDDKPRIAAIARAAQVVIDHGRGDAEIEALTRMMP